MHMASEQPCQELKENEMINTHAQFIKKMQVTLMATQKSVQ